MLTDEACERLLSGRLTEADAALRQVGWFLEDVRVTFSEPVPTAVRRMHPSAMGSKKSSGSFWPPEEQRQCRPPRSWWSGTEVRKGTSPARN